MVRPCKLCQKAARLSATMARRCLARSRRTWSGTTPARSRPECLGVRIGKNVGVGQGQAGDHAQGFFEMFRCFARKAGDESHLSQGRAIWVQSIKNAEISSGP